MEKTHKEALAQDASVFDYDGVYDQMHEEKVNSMNAHPLATTKVRKEKKEARYVQAILERAKKREVEMDRSYEKFKLKERQEDDHMYGDKEKFVTSAYRAKLEERKRWELEDKKNELREEAEGARARGDMSGFYSNLLTRNIATGADVAKSSTTAYTVGSQREAGRLKRKTTAPSAENSRENGGEDPAQGVDSHRISAPQPGNQIKSESEHEHEHDQPHDSKIPAAQLKAHTDQLDVGAKAAHQALLDEEEQKRVAEEQAARKRQKDKEDKIKAAKARLAARRSVGKPKAALHVESSES